MDLTADVYGTNQDATVYEDDTLIMGDTIDDILDRELANCSSEHEFISGDFDASKLEKLENPTDIAGEEIETFEEASLRDVQDDGPRANTTDNLLDLQTDKIVPNEGEQNCVDSLDDKKDVSSLDEIDSNGDDSIIGANDTIEYNVQLTAEMYVDKVDVSDTIFDKSDSDSCNDEKEKVIGDILERLTADERESGNANEKHKSGENIVNSVHTQNIVTENQSNVIINIVENGEKVTNTEVQNDNKCFENGFQSDEKDSESVGDVEVNTSLKNEGKIINYVGEINNTESETVMDTEKQTIENGVESTVQTGEKVIVPISNKSKSTEEDIVKKDENNEAEIDDKVCEKINAEDEKLIDTVVQTDERSTESVVEKEAAPVGGKEVVPVTESEYAEVDDVETVTSVEKDKHFTDNENEIAKIMKDPVTEVEEECTELAKETDTENMSIEQDVDLPTYLKPDTRPVDNENITDVVIKDTTEEDNLICSKDINQQNDKSEVLETSISQDEEFFDSFNNTADVTSADIPDDDEEGGESKTCDVQKDQVQSESDSDLHLDSTISDLRFDSATDQDEETQDQGNNIESQMNTSESDISDLVLDRSYDHFEDSLPDIHEPDVPDDCVTPTPADIEDKHDLNAEKSPEQEEAVTPKIEIRKEIEYEEEILPKLEKFDGLEPDIDDEAKNVADLEDEPLMTAIPIGNGISLINDDDDDKMDAVDDEGVPRDGADPRLYDPFQNNPPATSGDGETNIVEKSTAYAEKPPSTIEKAEEQSSNHPDEELQSIKDDKSLVFKKNILVFSVDDKSTQSSETTPASTGEKDLNTSNNDISEGLSTSSADESQGTQISSEESSEKLINLTEGMSNLPDEALTSVADQDESGEESSPEEQHIATEEKLTSVDKMPADPQNDDELATEAADNSTDLTPKYVSIDEKCNLPEDNSIIDEEKTGTPVWELDDVDICAVQRATTPLMEPPSESSLTKTPRLVQYDSSDDEIQFKSYDTTGLSDEID
ncbi:unnamed protein product [Owenia fusiformis]|uniref:Uncharacterized protein n=1 Tax=Owenia fusiformis TaxID=6347 RepID=A0A8S4QEH3_OWEFU|nr:unnamed protein product [Owenia fusiformis]